MTTIKKKDKNELQNRAVTSNKHHLPDVLNKIYRNLGEFVAYNLASDASIKETESIRGKWASEPF